jgi:hypothetical protein
MGIYPVGGNIILALCAEEDEMRMNIGAFLT